MNVIAFCNLLTGPAISLPPIKLKLMLTLANNGCNTGSFTMDTGKTFSRLYSTQGKGKITWEYQGETDCKVVVNKATLSYPKFTDDIRAFAKFASNGDFVFIVKHDGKYYVIGCDDYRATVTPNGDSGDSAGSAKGVTIEIECPDVTPLPTYVGTLALSDGTSVIASVAWRSTCGGSGVSATGS